MVLCGMLVAALVEHMLHIMTLDAGAQTTSGNIQRPRACLRYRPAALVAMTDVADAMKLDRAMRPQ